MDYAAALESKSKQIKRIDAQRAKHMHELDQLIRAALDSGMTWVEVQTYADRSIRAIQQSLERSKPS